MKKYIAGTNDDGVRLSRFCEKICLNIPKSVLYKSFRNKRVKVNGKKQTAEYRIQKDDVIELYINDEFFDMSIDKKNDDDYIAKIPKLELDIVHQDENIILINKPSGLLCHSDNKTQANLIDSLHDYLAKTKEFLSVNENTFTPSLCNRIDQGTQGIVIAAKNYKSLVEMNSLIKENLVTKKYLCVTQNPVADGIYTAYLTRDMNTKKVSVTKNNTANSKEIITAFKTLKCSNKLNLIEATLITGRTHQIRAHLAFLGSPIIGDSKYGTYHPQLKNQLLSAYKITFGDINSDSLLHYLSAKTFVLTNCAALDYYTKHTI